ncbi:hypothetical protein [Comamonas thiooxydans]|jgi:hypothetical protein|uniref:hypothetical protein n=1 Tax=Comamonas thiooxydans TaxID=363952 RepID=UPI00311D7E60
MKKGWKNVMLAAPMLLVAMFSTAHARQVAGDSCADVGNGTFGGLLSKPVICANGKWHDAETLPMASVSVAKYSAAKKLENAYAYASLVGTPTKRQQRENENVIFSVDATVVGFNSDNTARVVVDYFDRGAGQLKHVDVVVPTGTETTIATDTSGAEYRMVVARNPS